MLALDEVRQLNCTRSVLFLLLLLSQHKLVVSNAPEFSELFFLLLGLVFLVLLALDLKSSASVYGGLHLGLSSLLLFKEAICLVFSLCYLSVEHLVSVVLKSLELSDLPVDHLLTSVLFLLEFLLFTFFLHVL